MKLPDSLAALDWVHVTKEHSDRLILDVGEQRAWCGCYPQGICIAMDTGLIVTDIDWLQRVCLWFASVRTCINDSLLVENERLFLLRLNYATLTSIEWENSLNKQQDIADWLIRFGERSGLSIHQHSGASR